MEELKSMIKKTSDTSLRAGCSVLQRVAVCYSVLQCDKARLLQDYVLVAECCSVLRCVAVCCSVLRCVAVCCSGAVRCKCAAVCCSVLQCAAVCCSVPKRN